MAKHQNSIFNLTTIERKTNIRKLKLNEFVLGKVSMTKLEKSAIKRLVIREANNFLQKLESEENE